LYLLFLYVDPFFGIVKYWKTPYIIIDIEIT